MMDHNVFRLERELAQAYDNLGAAQERCGRLLEKSRDLERENSNLRRAIDKLIMSPFEHIDEGRS